MLYDKPDVRYVDMCIYIDEHAYDPEITEAQENTIFQYLYFLCHMFASKGKFFPKTEYYDDFAIYAATHLFMRLRNPRQFEFNEQGERKVKLVKSILNYIKRAIGPLRIDFQQLAYSQAYSDSIPDVVYDSEYSFCDRLEAQIDEIARVEFKCCLGDIVQTARAYLKKIPYRGNEKQWNNIYTSCMLTFLNSITLKNSDIERIKSLKHDVNRREGFLERLYDNEEKNATLLFHLDENMRDYITVLTREMKHAVAVDLSKTTDTSIPLRTGMRAVIDYELGIETEE